MGIQGLLPLLKSIQKPTHLRNFAGQTLGVDAYGWLHRGTVACAIELAQGKPTRKYVDFAMNRVRMLIHFGVKPYIVFDGAYLPSKAHTEKEREERRKESKRLGLELLRMGKVPLAQLELQKAVDVTAAMARELIEELKRADVPYVVAPYEADSQMAYLEQQGIINGIISEDSDLLVFGAKCLLTKLDQYGECVMINRSDFTACREVSLVGWSDKEFRIMAMLSGCDYLPGIDKMGLKTAYRLVRKHKSVERIVRTVQFDGKMKVAAGYLEAFDKAEKTFLYQWVFCPEAQGLVNLNPVPADIDVNSMPYVGSPVDAEIAIGVAKGDLDPNTKRPIIFNKPQHPASVSRTFSTPDLKQGVPITDFFKKRTPLAELDPNSFTPSPSQERLLQNQRGATWSASQISAGTRPITSRLSTGHTPASAPQPVRRTVSATPNFGLAPPKRQRLCSNNFPPDSTKDFSVASTTATSRFFSKQPAQASPSVRKASTQRTRDEFEIFSDDSIAEAAAAMTETAELEASQASTSSPKKRKKMSVLADSYSTSDDNNNSQSQLSTFDLSQSIHSTSLETDTPSTSFSNSQPLSQDQPTVFDKGISNALSGLKARYSFGDTKPSPQGHRPQRRRGLVHESLRAVSTSSEPGRSSIVEPRRTSGSGLPNADEEEAERVPASSPPTAAAEEVSPGRGREEEEQLRPLRSRLSPGEAKGSEDFIVRASPCSEREEEEEQDEELRSKINLGRFAFVG
ncbi:hypothetical protein MBLNU230_g1449t1 [Neophaeotheca triangularis]